MKNASRVGFLSLSMSLLLTWGCIGPGVERYDLGKEMVLQKQWEDAILHFEEALKIEPDNEEYKIALKEAKNNASSEYATKAKSTIDTAPFLTLELLDKALQDIEQALKYHSGNSTAKTYQTDLLQKKSEVVKQVNRHYLNGKKALENENWGQAVLSFNELLKLNVHHQDATQLIQVAKEKRAAELYDEAVGYMDKENWAKASRTFVTLLKEHPAYKDAESLLQKSQENDNPQYFKQKAQAASSLGNWDRAVELYTLAMAYPGQHDVVNSQLQEAKKQAAIAHLKQCEQALNNKQLFIAHQEFMTASLYNDATPTNQNQRDIKNFIKRLICTSPTF